MTTATAAAAGVAQDTDSPANEPAPSPALSYATPWPKHRWAPSAPAQRLFWEGVRKVILSGGLGLIVYGAASIASDVNRHTAPVAAAWGVAFVALMLPLPLRSPRRKKRRRRAAHTASAAATPTSGI